MTAGELARCASCGGDSWTGEVCTRCEVLAATDPQRLAAAGFYDSFAGKVMVGGDQAEVVLAQPAESVAELTNMADPRLPLPVRSLATQRASGWRSRVVLSQGWEPKGSHVELISVRLAHRVTKRQAFAVYRRLIREDGTRGGWSWKSIYVWGPDLAPFGGCGLTDLKWWLKEQAGMDSVDVDEWMTGIRETRALAGDRAKRRTADHAEVKHLAAEGWSVDRLLAVSAAVKRQEWTREDIAKILKPSGRGNRRSEEAS